MRSIWHKQVDPMKTQRNGSMRRMSVILEQELKKEEEKEKEKADKLSFPFINNDVDLKAALIYKGNYFNR